MRLAVQAIRPAIVITVLLVLLVGLVYPFVVTGLGQLLFPYQANGSLRMVNGKVIGSDLIGQYWTSPRYFHGRPSATLSDDGSHPEPYNAANSGASNLGPTNKTLITTVQQRVAALQKENPGVPVPVDLVTSSGSGLDPDISPAAAYFQAPRIARVRGLSLSRINQLIVSNITGRFLFILGDPYVNVLQLNLVLDQLKS